MTFSLLFMSCSLVRNVQVTECNLYTVCSAVLFSHCTESKRPGCLWYGGMIREGRRRWWETGVLMRSCTDLCWKLSGRAPPAVPLPAPPPSVGSSVLPHCAGASSGQHLDTGQQGERLGGPAGSTSCAGIAQSHPNSTWHRCSTLGMGVYRVW